MNIKVTKQKLSKKEVRKLKLLTIQDKKIHFKDGYNWELTCESADEKIEDFNLFCISIVKDLLYKRFYTNEKGELTYEGMKDKYDETLDNLEHLYYLIYQKKRKRMNINIRRQKLDDLEQFLRENEIEPASTRFGYEWNLKGETTDESIEDFHLFCISIVKNLITEEFKTNEKGKIIYDISNVTKNNFNEEKYSYLFDNDEEDENEEDDEDEEYEDFDEKEYLLDNLQYLFSAIAKRKIDNENSGR